MPFDVQCRLVTALATEPGAFVSVDPHHPVTDDTLPDWRRVLSNVDAFFPSDDELMIDGVATSPETVLPSLVAGRLRFVVFKRGAQGGVLYDAHERRFHPWAARVTHVVDQTGAGDTFAAAFVAAHLEGLTVERSLQRAIVSASVAIEAWGPEALFTGSRTAASARLEGWYGMAGRE
jgi:sugar/nucleoside kinase (ribokinase family)